MKILALIILGLGVVGCGKTEEPVNTDEGKHDYGKQPAERPTPTDQNTTKANPAKELTLREKVVGTYEGKEYGDTYRAVFLPSGVLELYLDGRKEGEERKWKVAKGELHVIHESDYITVHRINKDSSITLIAKIAEGKREEAPKRDRITFKKIK